MTDPKERLRELRMAAGMTQKQLATAINERLGLAYYPQTINMMEHTKREPPSRVIVEWCALTGHPEEAAAICARFGKCHPVTSEALTDPDFATRVYQLAVKEMRKK